MGFFDGFASAIPNLAASIFNVGAQRETNATMTNMSNKQMEFQERMSGSAHQREVADLKAAGLNPVLSAGGSGSTTPPGSQATLTAPKIELPDFLAYGVSLKQLEQMDQKIGIDKANSAASIAKDLSQAEINKMEKILKQKGLIRAELEGSAAEKLQKMLKFIMKGVKQQESPLNKSLDEMSNPNLNLP